MNAYVADPVEWAALFKMPDAGPPGLWRVVFPAHAGTPDDALLDPTARRGEDAGLHANAGRLRGALQGDLPRAPARGKRLALGRVLLAGDAAHLNNPLGAFGLNSGIHDAVNLADKLGAGLARRERTRRCSTSTCASAASRPSTRCRRCRSATSGMLEERDPEVQRARMEELVATAGDRAQARAFLLDSSMISGLQKSEAIT